MTVTEARKQFPHTWTETVYLNHAAVSPISFAVREGVGKYLEKRALKGIEPYPWAMKMMLETKIMLGALINARAEDIAFVLNTSDGLNILATGLDWKAGDHIILNAVEFPANLYPFLNFKRFGVNVEILHSDDQLITPEQIAAAIRPETKLVSVSSVQFMTGQKLNLNAIGKICREKDILFAVDAIQGLPHARFDVIADNIDFVSCGSHKWLMSPEGTAWVYANERALSRISQAYLGWTSITNPFDHTAIDPTRLRPDSGRFENGTLNYVGMSGLKASLEFFNEFGLEQMTRNVLDLSGYLHDRLSSRGINVITPKDEAARAGIITFDFDNAEAVHARLLKQDVVISLRVGRLRVSPHFYNTEEELRKFMIALLD
jgi:cysteine desulfurase / selenocysteine lyase